MLHSVEVERHPQRLNPSRHAFSCARSLCQEQTTGGGDQGHCDALQHIGVITVAAWFFLRKLWWRPTVAVGEGFEDGSVTVFVGG